MITDDAPHDLLVLMKPGLARVKQEWHYHLANAAGRPRCGALLNLRAWQLRTLDEPPADLCGRCARLLSPKARHTRSTSPRPRSAEESEAQLGLPLEDVDEDATMQGDII